MELQSINNEEREKKNDENAQGANADRVSTFCFTLKGREQIWRECSCALNFDGKEKTRAQGRGAQRRYTQG